jgi:hypothetical protein
MVVVLLGEQLHPGDVAGGCWAPRKSSLVGLLVAVELPMPDERELAGKVELGVDDAGATELVDEPGVLGAAVDDAEVLLAAALEVENGERLLWSQVPGTMLFFKVRRACVTSNAFICWPTPSVPSHSPVYH